ncbi:MAG: N-acetylmuramoyl-L-alanine amidase [Bacteroidales bacterium]|jgi:N-acetyl-anhydromuramyl-L-alanine amidase AmpD|nr:N-acetylmuramoyl-L-alanine amidase [Bacteroidales bacterium]
MKIYDCFLDDKNEFAVDNTTIGKMIAQAGKQHLWGPHKAEARIDTVVIHYMSAVYVTPDDPYNVGQLLKLFCDYGVSCHYLITREGEIYRLVPEEARAWHCGGSIMPDPDNRRNVNDFSIGIELAATAKSGFTEAQYDALCKLCADIEERHGIGMKYIGHDHIAGKRAVELSLRKDIKTDPGPLFDWDYFTRRLR